jgi:hypothetical protein
MKVLVAIIILRGFQSVEKSIVVFSNKMSYDEKYEPFISSELMEKLIKSFESLRIYRKTSYETIELVAVEN